jgi:hypothetical protein
MGFHYVTQAGLKLVVSVPHDYLTLMVTFDEWKFFILFYFFSGTWV